LVKTVRSAEKLNGEVQFSDVFKNGQAMLSGSNGKVLLIKDFRMEDSLLIDTGPDPIKSADISPDGHYLLTADQTGRVKLWYTSDGLLQSTIPALSQAVTRVRFSPDGKSFVVLTKQYANLYVTGAQNLLELAEARIPPNYFVKNEKNGKKE